MCTEANNLVVCEKANDACNTCPHSKPHIPRDTAGGLCSEKKLACLYDVYYCKCVKVVEEKKFVICNAVDSSCNACPHSKPHYPFEVDDDSCDAFYGFCKGGDRETVCIPVIGRNILCPHCKKDIRAFVESVNKSLIC
jgi:hypothetical protein